MCKILTWMYRFYVNDLDLRGEDMVGFYGINDETFKY